MLIARCASELAEALKSAARIVFVLDIDSTLVHTESNKYLCPTILAHYPPLVASTNTDYTVFSRPGIRDLVDTLRAYGTVMFWSAGNKEYVDTVVYDGLLRYLDLPTDTIVLNGSECARCSEQFGVLKHVDYLTQSGIVPANAALFIIDDLELTCRAQPSHSIQVDPFYYPATHDDVTCAELVRLLRRLAVGDVTR